MLNALTSVHKFYQKKANQQLCPLEPSYKFPNIVAVKRITSVIVFPLNSRSSAGDVILFMLPIAAIITYRRQIASVNDFHNMCCAHSENGEKKDIVSNAQHV